MQLKSSGSIALDHAAIDHDCTAGHVGTGPGSEETDHSGKLLGLPVALQRDALQRFGDHLLFADPPFVSLELIKVAGAIGRNPSRSDRIDQDVVGGQFVGQAFCQAEDPHAENVGENQSRNRLLDR